MLIREANTPDCDWISIKSASSGMCATHHEDHDPATDLNRAPHGEGIDKRDNVEEEKGRDGRLIVEKLHARHLELPVVASNPDRVQRGRKNSREGEDNSQSRGGLNLGISGG